MSQATFWRMTPREFYRESDAAQQRWKDEAERDLATAWHIAALVRQAVFGKLPDLQTILDGARTTTHVVQSIEDLSRQLTGVLGKPRPASPEALAALRLVKGTNG